MLQDVTRVRFYIGEYRPLTPTPSYSSFANKRSGNLNCNGTFQPLTLTTGTFNQCLMTGGTTCPGSGVIAWLSVKLVISNGTVPVRINFDSTNAASELFVWLDR